MSFSTCFPLVFHGTPVISCVIPRELLVSLDDTPDVLRRLKCTAPDII